MQLHWLGRLLGRPRYPDVTGLVSEAHRLMGVKERPEALATVEKALAIDPENVAALQLQGSILCELGRAEAGLTAFHRALTLDRDNASLHFDCGNAHCLAGDRESAEIEYRIALDLSPNFGDAYCALGGLLMDMRRHAEAAAVLTQALALRPDDIATQRRLAFAAYHLFDYATTCRLYEPLYDSGHLDMPECYAFGAAALNVPGKGEQARAILEGVIAKTDDTSPFRKLATLSLANCHLLAGRWREGFRLYEGRHEAIRVFDPLPVDNIARLDAIRTSLAAIPEWDGSDCRGKRLLVWTEQGLGDVIMFLRFLSVLSNSRQAAEVHLLCEDALMPLAECCSLANFFVLPSEWRAQAGEFDAQCSIVSLPYLLDIGPEETRNTVPYLRAPAGRRSIWRERAAALPGLRVGLVWAGNPSNHIDVLRSVAFESLRPVLAVGGVSFVSLQKVSPVSPDPGQLVDWMPEVKDFADTAAIIEDLDLVIAVDTAVAHLAGAQGKPVWLLNRYESEWRWMRDREDTPWYPTMRIFTQIAPRDWKPVIECVAAELAAFVAARNGTCPAAMEGTIRC